MTKSNTKLTNDCSRPAERGNKKHPRQSKKALRPGLEYSGIRVFFILVIGYFGVTIWVFFFYIFGIWYLDTSLCRYFDKWSKCVQQKFARSWEWEGKNKPRDRQKCNKKKVIKSNPTLKTQLNGDNGHFFSCQSTDWHKVNLANADTSLSTVCCNKPFVFYG